MYCKKCGKFVFEGTDLCRDCAASETTSNQSGMKNVDDGEMSQREWPIFRFTTGHSFLRNHFIVKTRNSMLEWLIICFSIILLVLYLIIGILPLLVFAPISVIFGTLIIFLLFFCGFACFSSAHSPLGNGCSLESSDEKDDERYRKASSCVFLFQKIIKAKDRDYSSWAIALIAIGSFVFVLCVVLSFIMLFCDLDYGYGHLNFLNSVLVFLFFLVLGILYLSFSYVLTETSHSDQKMNEKMRCFFLNRKRSHFLH